MKPGSESAGPGSRDHIATQQRPPRVHEVQFQFQFILLSTNKIISPKAAVVAKQATTNLCGELSQSELRSIRFDQPRGPSKKIMRGKKKISFMAETGGVSPLGLLNGKVLWLLHQLLRGANARLAKPCCELRTYKLQCQHA